MLGSQLNIKETDLSNGIHLSPLMDCKCDITSRLMQAPSCKTEVLTVSARDNTALTKAVVWKGHKGRHVLMHLFHLSQNGTLKVEGESMIQEAH